MRRPIGTVSAVCAAVLLAASGCGGGSGSTTSNATTTAMTPAAERAQIRKAWTDFFSGKTSAATKISLLENGAAFESAIKAQASSAIAKQAGATVSKVILQGPTKATVHYTISLAGAPVLKNQTGTAVKVDGSWKVGDASFCRLLALQGAAPKACSQSG
jgi:hypothetical protein